MTAKILDGKKIADKLLAVIKKQVLELKKKNVSVGLAIMQVGSIPASTVYVKKKLETAKSIGVLAKHVLLPEKVLFSELARKVNELNADKQITGIIIQLPLPSHLNAQKALSLVAQEKDVDGFHPINQGLLFAGNPLFVPATVKGIMHLIESIGIKLEGKHAVVIGRSVIVGKPIALMLLSKNATVTVCHSKTRNLGKHSRQADILVVAVGKTKLVKKNMVKKNAIVIDVGINKIKEKITGDADFENVKKIASWITPVPGGVGPMTVACLIENTVKAAKMQNNKV